MQRSPTIYAIAGAPAAGKTSFIAQAMHAGKLPNTAFIHDCDAVMQLLPGYQAQLKLEGAAKAFATWELPARILAEEQLQFQIDAKADIIYDRTCALSSSYNFIKDLVIHQQYRLIFYMLHVEPEQALIRTLAREAATGRHMPESIMLERLQMINSLWPEYLQLATSAHLLDSNQHPVKLIADFSGDKLQIYDHQLYSSFIKTPVLNNSQM